jgi:hypothetical protein
LDDLYLVGRGRRENLAVYQQANARAYLDARLCSLSSLLCLKFS